MAIVQSDFEAFNNAIRINRYKKNKTLQEKRDIIRSKLEENLPDVFKSYNESCPAFTFYDQGSYQLGTGVMPLDGEYDIDQGLYFSVRCEDHPDPVLLKQRVYEALNGHTKEVRVRHPCVTVFYQQAGERAYHVDIAVYATGEMQPDGKPRIAKGKTNSERDHRYWEVSDMPSLKHVLFKRFANSKNDRKQFRRIIRYLKRWKDENFQNGEKGPTGIALTCIAHEYFEPQYISHFEQKADDLEALRMLVHTTLSHFAPVWDENQQRYIDRLTVRFPVEPYDDLLQRMTNGQMETFKQKWKELLESLEKAKAEDDPATACEILRRVFGNDFPAGSHKKIVYSSAISTSSSSA